MKQDVSFLPDVKTWFLVSLVSVVCSGCGVNLAQQDQVKVSDSAPLTINQMVGVLVNEGEVQRSKLSSVKFIFADPVLDEDVAAISIAAAKNAEGSTLTLAVQPSTNPNEVMVTLPASVDDGPYNIIFRGKLLVVVHKRYGDSNGDRKVDDVDLSVFQAALGTSKDSPEYRAYFDFNGDGVISNSDFFQFRRRYNIPSPF